MSLNTHLLLLLWHFCIHFACAETETILPSTKSKGKKQKAADRERERDRSDRETVDPVERVERERELRDSPSTPSTLITDAEDIDDVDDNSMPIAPQPLEKSPAPSRTKSANFAVMGDSAEVSVAWGGGRGDRS